MNLSLNYHVECVSFSEKRYLAIGGNQLTLWEEVLLNDEHPNSNTHAWFNVHAVVMPRAFVDVVFSKCEKFFVTAEAMVGTFYRCLLIAY